MRFLQILSGSVVVYVLVSCASAATDSWSGGSAPLDASVLVDSMANPVEAANAQTAAPIVATESCDKIADSGVFTSAFAEHSFPGYSAMQLAKVLAVGTLTSPGTPLPAAYTQASTTIYVRDGYVAAYCGNSNAGAPSEFSSVTFTLSP